MMTIKQTIYRDFREHGINEEFINLAIEKLEKWLIKIEGNDIRIDSRLEFLHQRVLNLIYRKSDQYMIEALVYEDVRHPFVPLFRNRTYE